MLLYLFKDGDVYLFGKYEALINVIAKLELARPELDRKLKVLRDNVRKSRFYVIVFSILVPVILFLLSVIIK